MVNYIYGKLSKNIVSYIEPIQEETSHYIYTASYHQKTILIRQTRHVGHCWKIKDELMSDVLYLTHSHGRTGVGPPART